ncbi:ABC transporter permease [Metabacillus niabensis]|uniref:Aldouronate transport system permease protein n=1 Tax=Metabacillus niabensis TaxID=324854 RepID=A0ABT9YWU1_9BACI|nr:ABC transporter permease subunit [Metabacillus niabensis]MDQ0224459.1 putative aldouronate transport system permease protein [Metabacillus niabensis]
MAKLEKEATAFNSETKSSLNTKFASFIENVIKDFKRNKVIYLMVSPVVLYYIIFQYGPMYGLQIAFKDYSPVLGFLGSPWVGFDHFIEFFNSYYFWRLLTNTILLSLYSLLFAFPAGIILALLLNEVKGRIFKRTVQTITYMPHFVSLVVIVGILFDFTARDGVVNSLLVSLFGIEPIAFMREAEWFRTLFIGSDIWQNVGWSSIIFLAAMSNIDPALYEAAKMDGAGRFKQMIHITLPGIMPTIVILLILLIGKFMTVGDEKILLMYNPTTYETADVIGTYVYRKGILESNFSYSAAVGLFKAVIAFTLLIIANGIARKVGDTKLW